MLIKITRTPTGTEPLWVRQPYVGMEVPATQVGDRYAVNREAVLDNFRERHRHAALDWLAATPQHGEGAGFSFAAAVCETVQQPAAEGGMP